MHLQKHNGFMQSMFILSKSKSFWVIYCFELDE